MKNNLQFGIFYLVRTYSKIEEATHFFHKIANKKETNEEAQSLDNYKCISLYFYFFFFF